MTLSRVFLAHERHFILAIRSTIVVWYRKCLKATALKFSLFESQWIHLGVLIGPRLIIIDHNCFHKRSSWSVWHCAIYQRISQFKLPKTAYLFSAAVSKNCLRCDHYHRWQMIFVLRPILDLIKGENCQLIKEIWLIFWCTALKSYQLLFSLFLDMEKDLKLFVTDLVKEFCSINCCRYRFSLKIKIFTFYGKRASLQRLSHL